MPRDKLLLQQCIEIGVVEVDRFGRTLDEKQHGKLVWTQHYRLLELSISSFAESLGASAIVIRHPQLHRSSVPATINALVCSEPTVHICKS
ncbi:hypothetical protein PSAB6_50139 [Paraburkholderia sabiae]|nr:hypothetical protein PSAB6_50139 [Paraburkholderia sabiae]